jgi:hypothetical protein
MRSSVARPSLFLLLVLPKKQAAASPASARRQRLTLHRLRRPFVLHLLALRSEEVCHVHSRYYILMLVAWCYARTFVQYSLSAGGATLVLIGPLVVVPKLRLLFWWAISNLRSPFYSPTIFCSIWQRHGRYEYEFMNELVQPGRAVEAAEMEEQQQQQTQAQEQVKTGVAEARPRPEPITIDGILHSGPNSPMRPPPTERLPVSPTTRTSYESVHASTLQGPSHSRSSSLASTAKESKRLSLSFPVLPPTGRPSRPPSWANSPVTPAEPLTSPTEGNFLTVLAAQERRVLELKEELQKAEEELVKLKKQWSNHESMRKRSEVRRVQQLQPLSATIPILDTTEEDVDGSSQWMQKEMERRKNILSGVKTSNRKVFSGSRHTRTLSLLSPEKTTFSPAYPYPSSRRSDERLPPIRGTLTRSSTTSNVTNASPNEEQLAQLDGTVIQRDALLKTGKQMASDIKDGLFNFFEDIRQATVGEEAVNGTMQPPSRTAGGRQTPRPGTINTRTAGRSGLQRSQSTTLRKDARNDTFIDIGGSFWREHGLETPQKPSRSSRAASKQQRSSSNTSSPLVPADSDEAWDVWGTPIKGNSSPPTSQSGSSLDSDHPETPSDDAHSHTPLPRSSPSKSKSSRAVSRDRTVTPHSFHSVISKSTTPSVHEGKKERDAIPWPALNKLTPGNLKRTASHLMSEWEKSLSPTPTGDSDAHTSDSGLDYGLSPPLPGASKFKMGE